MTPSQEAARILRGIALERQSAEQVEFVLRGKIAKLEDLDALVLSRRHDLLPVIAAKYSSNAHHLIGRLKFWLAQGVTPEKRLAECSVWFPAIDSLETEINASLANSAATRAYRDEMQRRRDALATKVEDTVLDGLFVNAEAALRNARRAA